MAQKIRYERRVWGGAEGVDENGNLVMRPARTWEEAHELTLEYEEYEQLNRAAADYAYTYQGGDGGVEGWTDPFRPGEQQPGDQGGGALSPAPGNGGILKNSSGNESNGGQGKGSKGDSPMTQKGLQTALKQLTDKMSKEMLKPLKTQISNLEQRLSNSGGPSDGSKGKGKGKSGKNGKGPDAQYPPVPEPQWERPPPRRRPTGICFHKKKHGTCPGEKDGSCVYDHDPEKIKQSKEADKQRAAQGNDGPPGKGKGKDDPKGKGKSGNAKYPTAKGKVKVKPQQ